jgi:hypothetical protein
VIHMLAVAYGVGVDSTAMLVGMWKRGIRPDRILFADVGGENEATYAYLPIMAAWLESVGFPKITVVRYVPKNFKNWPPYYSLEENCLTNGTLPSISFQGPGKGACSMKWKQSPQHKHLLNDPDALAVWASGRKVRKAIGFDDSQADRDRRSHADAKVCTYQDQDGEFYDYWYPLQEWGWNREICKAEITSVGLPVPVKSSCFFCFAMQEEEVRQLSPMKLRRIVLLEARAKPRLTKVDGLWGQSYTYTRGSKDGRYGAGETRTGSMTDFIAAEGLLSQEEIERIQSVPAELINFQKAYAAGFEQVPLGGWLRANFPEMYPADPAGVEIVSVEYDEPEQTQLFPILQADGPAALMGY